MSECIIIGSGIAGIATAIRLRAQGHSVTVLEANSYAGGKLSAFSENGFRFDAGPSLFTMPQFVDELFALSGEDPRAHFEYERLDIGCHYFFEDGTRFESPSNPEAFARLLQERLGEDPKQVLNFLSNSAKLYDITAPVFLENSLHKLSTYLNRKGLKGILNLWRLNMFSTMHAFNARTFRNPKTTQFFDRFATYNGSNPYLAPATLNVIPHLEFGYGTYFPLNGMNSITTSLCMLAERRGVRFQFNTRVDEICIASGKTTGVRSGELFFPADVVVSNMDVYPTYQKLLKSIKMPEKVKNTESSSSALIFYWGIQHKFEELGLHNIFFSADYRREFEQIFKENTIGDDSTVYINITSKHKPDDAPEGCENWFVMVNVPANTGQDWDALIGLARERICDKISRLLKTDIRPLIVSESVLDPRSIESRTSSFRGALYGSSSNHRMAAFFRHANFSPDIRNLYFCGGSVHPGGGIPLCLLSARIVSGLIGK